MLKKARKYDRDSLHRRIIFACIALWVALLVLVFRYGWLQLGRGEEFSKRALAIASEESISQKPRGKILDRNGRELAVSRMAQSLCINPSKVPAGEAARLASMLSPIIGVSEKEIMDDIDIGGNFVWIKRKLEIDEEKAVEQLIKDQKFDCLEFREEIKRYYPNDMLAANVLGFVGTDNNGLDGIEQRFDRVIKGGVEEDQGGKEVNAVTGLMDILSNTDEYTDLSRDIVLTLDANIQFIVEQSLDKAMAETNPLAITAVVMDPRNGEVLAMASRPSYNPNKFGSYDPELWRNRAVSFIYEPGSTFKAMVAGVALQEKVVSPNQWYDDPGFVMVTDRRIQNWNGDSFGTVTFTDVVKNSINTAFAQIGLQIGGKTLTNYAKSFGFGEYTGIELPGEEGGILFNPDEMLPSDIATMAIGQSIAVTPIQLVTAMSAIANDGVLLRPNIIKQINNSDGTVYKEYEKKEVRRVIESATDKTLMGLLEEVVATGGGSKAAVKGYRIAGKTGTAQKISDNGVGYLDNRYIASFCGFAPVENPQITLLVVIDDPKGEFYGGQIAAPIASDIFTRLFRYLHIEPTSDTLMPTDLEYAKKSQPDNSSGPREIPPLPPGMVMMPDLRGKTVKEASQEMIAAGLNININGSGVCTAQDVSPYTAVAPGSEVAVYFTAP